MLFRSPGVGEDVLGAWEQQQEEESIKREERRIMRAGGNNMRGKQKAKVQEVYVSQRQTVVGESQGFDGNDSEEEHVAISKEKEDLGPLVVFACRHLYHQTCLEKALERQRVDEGKQADGFRCPIDG